MSTVPEIESAFVVLELVTIESTEFAIGFKLEFRIAFSQRNLTFQHVGYIRPSFRASEKYLEILQCHEVVAKNIENLIPQIDGIIRLVENLTVELGPFAPQLHALLIVVARSGLFIKNLIERLPILTSLINGFKCRKRIPARRIDVENLIVCFNGAIAFSKHIVKNCPQTHVEGNTRFVGIDDRNFTPYDGHKFLPTFL